MLSIRRPILFLILAAFVFALVPAAPAQAQIMPGPLTLTVSIYGAGSTLAEAEEMALNQLREDYFVLSYTTSDGRCHIDEILGIPFCSIKVTARVIRKVPLFP